MENEKESAKNPERDQRAATPISIVETPLTLSVHDGLTLPAEGKAQIGSRRANLVACSAEMFSDNKFQPIGFEIFESVIPNEERDLAQVD